MNMQSPRTAMAGRSVGTASRRHRRMGPLLALAMLMIPCIAVTHAFALVKDGGHFFSSSTMVQAGELISGLNAQTGKTVLVETFSTIPPAIKARYPSPTIKAFFYNWAARLGKAHHVNGVVILMCRSPGYLVVRADKATLKTVFPPADQAAANHLMLALCRSSQFSAALLSGLDLIARVIKSNSAQLAAGHAPAASAPLPMAKPNPGPTQSHKFMILILVIAGAFLFFWLFTRRSAASAGGAPAGPAGGNNPQASGLMPGTTAPTPPPGTSGAPQSSGAPSALGGFGTGLLGGVMGGMAGNMLFNSMEGGRSSGGATPDGAAGPADGGGANPAGDPSADAPADAPGDSADWSGGDSADASGGAFGGADDSGGGDDAGGADDSGGGDDGGDDGGSF